MLPYSIRQLSSAVYVEMGVVVAYKQILHFFQYMFYMQLWVVLPPGCWSPKGYTRCFEDVTEASQTLRFISDVKCYACALPH